MTVRKFRGRLLPAPHCGRNPGGAGARAPIVAMLLLSACPVITHGAARSSESSPEATVRGYLQGVYYSRDPSRLLDPKADSAGDGCYSLATERWRVRGARRYGNSAEVPVDVWTLAEHSCDGAARYWPPKRIRVWYVLRRTSGKWKVVTYHPIQPRRDAARYRHSPFYLVIAGSFRDEHAASRHAEWVANKAGDDLRPVVRASEELAGLQPGWKVVVPDDGECFSRAEASAARKRLAAAGVPVYVARIR